MKILAIRIKNLASLDGLTKIDFTKEPLCSAGIFAITGPTGAGKSTILDALCLALYAKTPRYLQAKETGVSIQDIPGIVISQGDVRGILRDGTGDGFAEVDFVGVDRKRYRARWSVNRARGKVDGAMQNESLSITNIETGIVLASKKTEACKEIERLVGLNFEQFTRSVLLAQGDFTAFMKADKDEKASLLEKLTGTHIYSEISRQVFIRCKEADNIVQELKHQFDSVNILNEEQLIQLTERKTALEKELAEYEHSFTRVTAGITWHERLAQLEASRQQALTLMNKAQEDIEQASGRIETFNFIDQVQKIRSEVESANATKKKLKLDQVPLESALSEMQQLSIKLSDLDKSIIEAHAQLIINKENKEKAIPLIDEAKEFDVRIGEKQEQLQHAFQEVDIAENKYHQLSVNLKDKRTTVDTLYKDITELNQWKQENLEREPIAENIKLIQSKLIDAKKFLDSIEAIKKQRLECEHKNSISDKLIIQLQKKYADDFSAIQLLRMKCGEMEKELSLVSIAEIEKERSTAERFLEQLLAAQSHWALLYADKQKLRSIDAKLLQEKSTLSKDLKKLAGTKQGLSNASEIKISSEKRLHRAQLQVAEDVEELRASLVEGEECPVCGSIHHPYSIDQPQPNGTIRMLAEELKEYQMAFDKLYSEQVTLQSRCNLTESTILDLENESKDLQNKIRKQEFEWTEFPIYETCSAILESEVTGRIQQEIVSTKQLQQALIEKIGGYRKNNILLEEEKQSLHGSEIKLRDLKFKLESEQIAVSSNCERITELDKQQEFQQEELKGIVDHLDPFFANKTWLENWKSTPVQFLELITQFEKTWKNKIKQLESSSSLLVNLEKDIEHLASQEISCKLEKEKKQAMVDRIKTEMDHINQKRNQIFKGDPISEVEYKLQFAVNEAQEILDTINTEKHQTGNQFAASGERVSHLRKTIEEDSQHLESLTTIITKWIVEFNEKNNSQLDAEKVSELLGFSHDWIQSERYALKRIHDAITQSSSILQERDLQLSEHIKNKLTQNTLEELLLSKQSIIEKRAEAGKEEIEIGIRLKQDRENKRNAGRLFEQIKEKQAISENWSRLNEMIGSADGKKFRQVAQEYTLDVLLGYANIHLHGLTKRYQVQRIPSTLSLQVMDKDMGDEIRTVYSLSGGESFLVSLALALGLASLSSSRMKVESLFIDEGFGSLDPTTLNIAMDALESLHNMGRKVGVISHVQEMTERIPTQIRVTKLSSGKSKIEIDGCLLDNY